MESGRVGERIGLRMGNKAMHMNYSRADHVCRIDPLFNWTKGANKIGQPQIWSQMTHEFKLSLKLVDLMFG